MHAHNHANELKSYTSVNPNRFYFNAPIHLPEKFIYLLKYICKGLANYTAVFFLGDQLKKLTQNNTFDNVNVTTSNNVTSKPKAS